MAEPTDGELVGRTRGGDREAYGELVARYQGHVYGLAYSLVDNWAEAQDIAQEAFIRAYVNLHQLREPERFAAWLRRVAFSVGMNWLKAHRPGLFGQLEGRVDLEMLEVPDFRPGPPEVVERRELAGAVLRAVGSLPRKYRVPLTMFHLDGLSYQKVADFLDIPLGTAKSLIHRARGKLREALRAYSADEIAPAVQEVFNEHRLPAGFAEQVLANIPELGWEKGECSFSGSIVACMEYLKQPVSYEFVMGVSGGAFKLFWQQAWRAGNNSLLAFLDRDAVYRRTFQAIGRGYERVSRADQENWEEGFREKIVESIQRGQPVIAWGGLVGPPESCVIAGYEQNGEVVVGRSYFQESQEEYYRSADWAQKCCGLIVIGDRKKPPAKRQILRDALEWAVELAHLPETAERVAGLAAYEAWAEALGRDEDFPEGDLETLTARCCEHQGNTLAGLWDARRAAAGFLKNMAEEVGSGQPPLLEAAAAYEEEVRMLEDAMELGAFPFQAEARRLQMADPGLRGRVAALLRQAKEKDAEAIGYLGCALQEMAPSGLRSRGTKHDV